MKQLPRLPQRYRYRLELNRRTHRRNQKHVYKFKRYEHHAQHQKMQVLLYKKTPMPQAHYQIREAWHWTRTYHVLTKGPSPFKQVGTILIFRIVQRFPLFCQQFCQQSRCSACIATRHSLKMFTFNEEQLVLFQNLIDSILSLAALVLS